jgi:group I intron endonuclease
MSIKTELKNVILETDEHRYCEIYKITNTINDKIYIGQAVSHILNHKKYRPYGMERRFACHVSEAFSNKKNQCQFLNNSIKKYGADKFTLELLRVCTLEDADKMETEEILKNNSLFPNGYNLKTGGTQFNHTDESKKRVSKGVVEYFKDKKAERFAGIVLDKNCNVNKYIHPLNRDNTQYGWYVLVQKKKADFGGVHIPLDESKKKAIDFLNSLKQ